MWQNFHLCATVKGACGFPYALPSPGWTGAGFSFDTFCHNLYTGESPNVNFLQTNSLSIWKERGKSYGNTVNTAGQPSPAVA